MDMAAGLNVLHDEWSFEKMFDCTTRSRSTSVMAFAWLMYRAKSSPQSCPLARLSTHSTNAATTITAMIQCSARRDLTRAASSRAWGDAGVTGSLMDRCFLEGRVIGVGATVPAAR